MREPFTRKFPRVRLHKTLGETFSALEAHIVWPNQEISDIVDLSYKGLAARRPSLQQVNSGEVVPLEVVLGAHRKFAARGRVVWLTGEAVGFEIDTLSAESHAILRDYIDPTLLGAGLRLVKSEFFSPEQSFDYWFQGASGVHVLIWLDSGRQKIERIDVDLNGDAADFRAGEKLLTPSDSERKALLVLSQIDKNLIPMEDFLRSIGS
jgi:hypothetical protein